MMLKMHFIDLPLYIYLFRAFFEIFCLFIKTSHAALHKSSLILTHFIMILYIHFLYQCLLFLNDFSPQAM